VAYGEVIKFYTERKGNTTYEYNYAAQYDEQGSIEWDYNINSGIAETVWMYNQLSYIPYIHLNVHYARGAGAGGGTAECSYGGWMNVSQNVAYQQTGTMLHETNHGVGVGTTGEWSNNSNLRENTSSGKWLGPRATKMVRLLENNDYAFMQGDATHMWAGTSSGSLTYGYGINGAHEDSYSPSNQILYFGNILITHALHQDGLVAPGADGIVASYTFTQDDDEIYYIKAEDIRYGFGERFLGVKEIITPRGTTKNFGNVIATFDDIKDNPYYQWKITYNPAKAMYSFYNVGYNAYLKNSNTTVSVSGASITTDHQFMLLPSRNDVSVGDFKAPGYWIVRGSAYNSNAVKTGASTSTEVIKLTASRFEPNNETGANQRFLLLTSSEAVKAETAARELKMARLNEIIVGCEPLFDVPVTEYVPGSISDFETTLSTIKNEKSSYTTPAEVSTAITTLLSAVDTYFTNCRPSDNDKPADLSFMWQNLSLASGTDYWTTNVNPTRGDGCYEFFEKTFDMYHTSESTVPAGSYRFVVQSFQRPGSYNNVYTDYIVNGIDNVNSKIYFSVASKKTTKNMANIWRDYTTTSLHSQSVSVNGKYIPNTRSSATAWFNKGYYTDSLFVSTGTTHSTLRVGLSGTTGSSYWVAFNGGLRVLFYGDFDEHGTGIDAIPATDTDNSAEGRAEGKFLENGRIIIRKNGKKYTLDGMMLK
jgi:hypothetical protein